MIKKCRICKHIYLPKAHYGHCPCCGCASIKLGVFKRRRTHLATGRKLASGLKENQPTAK